MRFIIERRQVDITHLQDKHGVKISCEEGCNHITLTPLHEKSLDMDQFEDASKAIASFINGFQTSTMHITPDAWSSVVETFEEKIASMKDKVKIQLLHQCYEIVLTGMKQEVEGLVGELEKLKTEIKKRLALEASKVTTTVNNIPLKGLMFLNELGFDKELQVKYDDTQVDIILDKGQVHICGPSKNIHKAAADIWQAVANMKDVRLEISPNATGILRSAACQSFIKEQLTANNLQALLTFDVKEEDEDEFSVTVLVMGMNSDVAHKASILVKTIISEENILLEEGQVQLEKSEKWRLFRNELTANSILNIKFDRNTKQLCLAGKKEDVASALRNVRRFLKENTIVSEVVELTKGCRRFLAKYREHDLRQIQEELNKHSTLIKGIEGDKDEDVVVTGTIDGVAKGKKMIRDLASTVESQKVPLDKPGMRKALNRSKGKKILALLENENKCVVEYCNADKDASLLNVIEYEEGDTTKKKKESECSFLTPEGKSIKVFKDNICDRNVDVIVNAASAKLQHLSGVSKAIFDAGGESIRDECDKLLVEHGSILEGQVIVTSAGKMPFKKVVHAVGPYWRKEATREKSMGKTPREERILRYAVSNALHAAKHFSSIALPAISTGASEFPRDLCANIMVDATLEFWKENPSCNLSEIQFTSLEDAVVNAFVTEMAARFGEDPSFLNVSKRNVETKATGKGKDKGRKMKAPTSSPVSSIPDGPNDITTPEGLKVVLVIGDMTREQASYTLFRTNEITFRCSYAHRRKHSRNFHYGLVYQNRSLTTAILVAPKKKTIVL